MIKEGLGTMRYINGRTGLWSKQCFPIKLIPAEKVLWCVMCGLQHYKGKVKS